MFAFVKSLFISTESEEQQQQQQNAPSESSSSSRSDDPDASSSKPSSPRNVDSDSDSSVSPVSSARRSVEEQAAKKRTSEKPELFVPITTDALSTSAEEVYNPYEPLSGALYWVSGLNFQCLMEECEVEVDGRLLVITNTKPENQRGPDETEDRKVFRAERLCNVRQHLKDSFQFFVREGADGGEEYGIQFKCEQQALRFRQQIFNALLDTAATAVEVECALAEYDTNNKEFVIISRSAIVRISERPSDNQLYFSVEDRSTPNDEDAMKRRLFADNLTKEIQMWPSVGTNQLSFWGPHHQAVSIDKMMFLLEMDVNTVGEAAIAKFFNFLAIALMDRSFIGSDADIDGESLPMDDEAYDVGNLGDPNVHREWRRKSVASAQESDDSGDEEKKYTTKPVYCADNSLTHRFMEVGSDRTFVCRGDQSGGERHFTRKRGATQQLQMKVYKREEGSDGEERLENVGTMDGKKFSYKGQDFVPSKGLLHQQEKKLLVAPEYDMNGDVYLMDLETEKVVQKWDADGTYVQSMFPTFKLGQATPDPTFLCANNQNVFLMDTRLQDSAKTTSINYLTNPQLSVGATDAEGHIVMGSKLGALRLYDGEANAKGDFKRAKTLLETVREPITSVDVTKDGSWIVATTQTYLVVFCTKLAGVGKTGFQTALGQQKPLPRYLMLSSDDVVKYQITEINFAPAKFDSEEDSIVTSSGNMAVVWDFGTVKRGKPMYTVRFAADAIKDVQISTASDSVVVAYPTAVGLFGTEKRRLADI